MTIPDPTAAAAAIEQHTELRTTLALAAGTAAKLFEYVEPGRDQVRLTLALYAEYSSATERIFRKFMDPRERRARKLGPRPRPRVNPPRTPLLGPEALLS